jgi:hypothetical protein
MSVEQMEIPVAEMEDAKCEAEYTIAPDGTVIESEAAAANAESLQEQMK